MVDTILTGDVSIAYLDESRNKRIYYSGTTNEYTLNQLYSALMDHFDEPARMDNPSPMSAQTPVEYTIGTIDTGDDEPWYITYDLMEKISAGALRTSGWTRELPGTGSGAIGIVVVPVSSGGSIVAGDEGNTISHADGDSGTLLEVISDGGSTDYLVIRPDTNASTDDWDSTSGTITEAGLSHTATQSGAAVTGEQIWANIYSIGTIETDTHIYLYQGSAADNSKAHVYSVNDNTQDWWGDGQIDICVPIRDFKSSGAPIIDEGYVTVFARKSTTEYAFFEVQNSTTAGGRNPAPLSTKSDLNNTTGYKSVTLGTSAGNWNVGDEVLGATSGARGIITATSGANPTITLEYYLVDDPLTDFNGSEAINNQDDTGTSASSGATSSTGPALATWFTNNTFPTISFANTTFDIDDDGTDEFYGITIDCNQNPLTEVYEWLKYITRRGETGTTNTDGIEGEQYIGGEVYLAYSGSVTGTVGEGSDVLQSTTLATGTVISHDTTNKVLLLRNTRGTFNTADIIVDQDLYGSLTPNSAAVTFAPNAVSPFGTFAGGTFFGARGVLLTDWLSADENNFQLTPIEGGTKARPQAITLTVSNLVGTDQTTLTDDRVAIFRLTGSGGQINKTEYSAAGGEAIGANTLVVDAGSRGSGTILQDTPGKTTGGVLRIRDADDNNQEYRLRYSSWTGSTFTLAAIESLTLTGATDTDTIVSSASDFATALRGDLVNNITQGAVSYITTVDDANTIQIDPPITGQTSGDTIEINTLPIAMNTADDVYVSLLDKYATASSESTSIVYSSQIYYRVVARNSENATKIIPFTADDTTAGTDRSTSVVRNEDTIIT